MAMIVDHVVVTVKMVDPDSVAFRTVEKQYKCKPSGTGVRGTYVELNLADPDDGTIVTIPLDKIYRVEAKLVYNVLTR